jgi:competence protein ComEA
VLDLPIDPNRADALTLETLPGIGPARAEAIIAERSRRPFRDLRDLMRVHGLGPSRVAALEGLVEVEAPLAIE